MESKSVFARIGHGWQHLFRHSDTDQYGRMLETMESGYARIEASIKFRSVVAMNDFFTDKDSASMLFVRKEIDFLKT